MANPNIVNVSTIAGQLAVANVTTESANLVVNSASSDKIVKLNTIMISNIDTTNDVATSVDILRGAVAYSLITNVVIQTSSAFTPFDKTLSIYLLEGDALRISANANSAAQVLCSYEEIS